MLLNSAKLAVGEIFDPTFRAVFWKALGITIAALIVVWQIMRVLVEALAIPFIAGFFSTFAPFDVTGGFTVFGGIIASIGLAVALAFLIGPTTAAIAGLFLDDVADHVEAQDYPLDPPGQALPFATSVIMALKFFGIMIAGNLLALFLLLVPGVNLIAFFAINGYLLGREYFEFAALRHHDLATVRMLRSKHSGTIIMGGLMIAGLLAVPILNLLTPLFGAALMVHLQKAIVQKEFSTR